MFGMERHVPEPTVGQITSRRSPSRRGVCRLRENEKSRSLDGERLQDLAAGGSYCCCCCCVDCDCMVLRFSTSAL